MTTFTGSWKRDSDELSLRQLGTRVVGWLTTDGTALEVNGTLHEETLTLLVEGEEATAKLSKGVLVIRGKVAAKGRWTLEPISIAVEGPGLHSLDEPRAPAKKRESVTFAGSWQASGSVGQDTASWYAQLVLAHGTRGALSGRLARWIEGWNPNGGPGEREQLRFDEISGTRRGDKATIVIDGEKHTLRREGADLELVSPLGRKERYTPIPPEQLLRSPADFAGIWSRGGTLPFDTGSWSQRLDLRVTGDQLTGRFEAARETWNILGCLERTDERPRAFSGTIRDGSALVVIDGAVATLRLSGTQLSVEDWGEASGLYDRG